MTTAQDKFQNLLRELFQFDCADLDFGIYRIMNYKRDVVQKFISTDLPKAIADELDRGAMAEQSQAVRDLTVIAGQITDTLGNNALDPDGHLAEAYTGTPLGKKYLRLKEKALGGRGREALAASIFNHLNTFFSRYYQDGDFISKRRYSKRQRYAIPYNGEEVYFHWANHDQYYIKTVEHFHDYTFTSRGVIVHFKIKAADVEQNNVKGDTRFFIPRVKEIDWNEKANQVLIPFEYRPLTGQEAVTFGVKNQQDKIIAEAVAAISRHINKENKPHLAIMAERRKNSDGQPVSYLEHHLRQYTRRNASDFFIHKDLKAFLSRELDFYLKNEVLNLDEMETAGEDRAEGWFQSLRVIKTVGGRIIDFLDQIESFQKMLWEKRKFITEAHYCITVGNIDERFYPEIAACDAQWAEWKELFHIDEEKKELLTSGMNKKEKRIALIKSHPTLVLDTKHFTANFVDRLMANFTNLDALTDGLLIHSENFQALSLLLEKYREKIKCFYIDPPYNTGSDDFLYKDGYQGSSWASMLIDRALVSRSLLTMDGLFFMQIGDEEEARSRLLLDKVFPERKNSVVVRRGVKNVQAQFSDIARLTGGHDLIHVYARTQGVRIPHLRQAHQVEKPGKWDTFWRGVDRPTMRYEFFGQNPETGQWRWEETRARNAAVNYENFLHKEVANKSLDEWYVENLQAGTDLDFVRRNDEGVVQYFVPPQGHRLVSDNWLDVSAAGTFTDFPTEKNVELLSRVISWNTKPGDWILDYFGGSGSTAHAALHMLPESRRFILIEMGQYFDTILLPRIKKVTFTPEWKDGKPRRMATPEEARRSPRIIKYMRLESYEDALNNIEFDETSGQQTLKFSDYLLKYMLKWESRGSETLLNVEKLARPFSYKLTVAKSGESVDKVVDIPETFNYLLGLHVATRKVYSDDGRQYLVYRGRIDHRQVVVVWRDTDGWRKEDLERDKKFVADQAMTEGADEVFVNGDSFIAGARALEPVFKARMFSTVEA